MEIQLRWDIENTGYCSDCDKKTYFFDPFTSKSWCKECWNKK